MKGKKKRIINSAVAVGCAVAVVFTGTFAWQAMSSAMNAFSGTENDPTPKTPPSANLHDDFSEADGVKKIYAENTGSTSVYVRVKLEEYLSVSANPNKKPSADDFKVHIPVSTGSIEEVALDGGIHEEKGKDFAWTMGGSEAFNSITGSSAFSGSSDQKVKDLMVADALGDADSSLNKYGDGSTVVNPGSSVKKTMDRNDGVITMAQYMKKSKDERAAFQGWVYDRDGYAYWSQPLSAGHATGMLLNGVKVPDTGSKTYYYAIDATMEYVDQEDLGAWTEAGEDGARVTTLNNLGQVKTSEKDQGAVINSGKQAGQTTIEATNDAKEMFDEIGDVPATAVKVTPSTLNLVVDGTAALKAVLTPSDSTDSITWSSSDPSIAAVDKYGNVTAEKVGTAVITATSTSGKTGTCNVTVSAKEVPVTDFTVSGQKSMVEKTQQTLNVAYTPEDATNKETTFKSNNEAVLTVDADGKVTAVAPGTTTVTVSCNGIDKDFEITVEKATKPLEDFSVNAEDKMTEGSKQTVEINYEPADADHGTPTFESSDPTVASVDDKGEITALKPGEATITVTVDGKEKSVTVTVEKAEVPLAAISINGEESMITGTNQTLTAVLDPEDADHGAMTWTSSDKAIATVDADGKVTAHKAGDVTITVTCDGKTDSINIKVSDAKVPLNGVALSGDKEMTREDTQTLVVDYNPGNADHGDPAFSSSDESIATVDPKTGEVTAVKAGDVTMTVTVDGKTSTLDIHVNGKDNLPLKETDNAKFDENADIGFDEYGRQFGNYHTMWIGYNATDTGYYYYPMAQHLPGSNQQNGEAWESYAMTPYTYYVDNPSDYTFKIMKNDEWGDTSLVTMTTSKGETPYIQGTHVWARNEIDTQAAFDSCLATATIRITENATGDYREIQFKYTPYAIFVE